MRWMRAMALFGVLGLASCAGGEGELNDAGQDGESLDGGDLGGPACSVSPWGLDCCDEAGDRTGATDCQDGILVCELGTLCECDGVPTSFSCSDLCGSDIAGRPQCIDGLWQCVPPIGIRTDTCPPDTCWGEPGECACCLDEGQGESVWPDCSEGEWVCPPGAAACIDC